MGCWAKYAYVTRTNAPSWSAGAVQASESAAAVDFAVFVRTGGFLGGADEGGVLAGRELGREKDWRSRCKGRLPEADRRIDAV